MLILVLAACDSTVDVDATSNVPARYSRVLITVERVWFNESATALPGDDTWEKFTLDDSRTIDLVDIMGGGLTSVASGMVIPNGTYRQVRIFLADRDDDLEDSAADLGAIYNNEVTLFDEDGEEQTYPLEVLNADQGIGIEMELEVAATDVGFGAESGDAATLLLAFDAARDLTEFRYSGETGFLLNPSLRAIDSDDAGTIRGDLSLAGLDFETETGRPEIQVTAQKLDESQARHVIVASTAISSSGEFVLYPLPFDEDEDETEYDLVIHGPEIQTIVIRGVPVTEAPPDDTAPLDLGTLAPELAAWFEVDIEEANPVVPRGARIGFYQTLPDDEAPYLVGIAAVDTVRGRFAQRVTLTRSNTISYGDYDSSFSLVSDVPEEGAARYSVAALSPHYGDGAFAATSLRPASPATDTATFSVPAISVPSPAVSGTVSVTVTVEDPGEYDRGVLILSREGAVVTVASLDAILQQSLGTTFIDMPDVPAGSASAPLEGGAYYLEAWTWDSDDPVDSFERHPGTELVDLRSTAAATGTVTVQN